ncbi:LamG-like jellyroll fold domain-containing protein [Micromonospora sp. Llam0]|uniref:LamG-like jellyroll fold domain-containing protein n=1 Tax=Micromonospora sp. Llam0 TaxID=2485143 RepID=UPI000F48B198
MQTGFGIADAAAVPAVTSGSDIRFADVRPDADLVLTPTKTGVSESIVLKSADAPTQWNFPLRLQGLAPELVGGGVELRDEAGEVRANIPPGFMYDSTPDPKTGAGVRSNGVTYALDRVGDAWNLRVTMDGRWLRDPARKFPVVVDPPITARDTTYIDSFVSSRDFANRDNSAETFLKVGTYNGGREKSAAYVRFFGAETLIGRYVQGASLNLYQTWARSCTASKLTVHRVYGDWWERDVLSWPGPAYDSANPVASKSFNRGGNCTSRPAGWESIPIDPERFTKWLDGRERWYGFSLRASNTDNNGEKFFYSSEYAGGGAPFIDLIYSDEGAAYSLPTRRFDPPVTPSTYGFLNVDVTNLGVTTWVESWDSPSPDLYGYIRNSAGTLVDTSVHGVGDIPVPHGVTVRLAVVTGFLPAGTYTITITMQDAQGRDFDSYYGVPHATVSFTVLPEATPEVVSFFPPNNAQVDRLRPALWAQYFDADNAPGGPYYWFRVCNGTADAPVGCQESQWVTSASWTVPAGVLSWGQTSFWYVAVHDGQNMSYLTGPYHLTPVVAQPEITHHLAGAPDGADVPGLNVQVGNYSTAVVDASVPVSGPPLEVSRTYNSQDPRSAGAFGAGWSTPWDQRITADPDGSGSVVVTLTSGRQVRFGRNADGSFVPPAGQPLTLVRGSGNWTLRDSSGQRRVFDDAGRIIAVVDGYGRQQQFLYTSGVLSQVRDVASGRSLSVTWSGGRVSTVRSDAPAVGAAQPTWTYSYTGNRLTRVCSPLSEQSCVEYQYQDSSHYRSIVIDDNPSAYWPLGETSGGTAANVVARKPGEYAAKYSGVTLGQPGALAGSADTAARFSSAANGGLALPVNLTNTSLSLTVELWFKAASGQRGTLYAYQDTDLLREPGDHTPALYVDSGGKLRGQLWAPGSTQMVSPARVDNGQWHHVVLVGAVDRQELYLNGTRIGSSTGHPLAMLNMRYAYVGNGSTTGWPAAGSGNFPFIGQIDDVAFYRHALAPTQISAHYAARAATSRMTGSIEPGPFTAMQASYDGRSGRITTLQDRNGAEWTVGQPTPRRRHPRHRASLHRAGLGHVHLRCDPRRPADLTGNQPRCGELGIRRERLRHHLHRRQRAGPVVLPGCARQHHLGGGLPQQRLGLQELRLPPKR